jgi:hypothetical protein
MCVMILRPRHRPYLIAALLGTLAIVVSGCGAGTDAPPVAGATHAASTITTSGAPTSASSTLPDLCRLLSNDTVSQAAGVHITSVTPEPDTNLISCKYSWSSGSIFVQYQLHSKGTLDYVKGNGGQSVAGLGEEAYWFPSGFDFHVAVNGDDQLIVNLVASSVTLNHGDLKSVAIAIATATVPLVTH